MFKTVSVRRKNVRIRNDDKEGLLNSYIINSTSTNLHLNYTIDNRKCFYFTDNNCPDFNSILSGLDLASVAIHLNPQMSFKLD